MLPKKQLRGITETPYNILCSVATGIDPGYKTISPQFPHNCPAAGDRSNPALPGNREIAWEWPPRTPGFSEFLPVFPELGGGGPARIRNGNTLASDGKNGRSPLGATASKSPGLTCTAARQGVTFSSPGFKSPGFGTRFFGTRNWGQIFHTERAF